MGDLHGDPEFGGQCPHRDCQAGRVEATGVGDDAHPAVPRQAQALLKLGQEGLGVAALGILHPVPAQDQHGEFGQVITGKKVQITAG